MQKRIHQRGQADIFPTCKHTRATETEVAVGYTVSSLLVGTMSLKDVFFSRLEMEVFYL